MQKKRYKFVKKRWLEDINFILKYIIQIILFQVYSREERFDKNGINSALQKILVLKLRDWKQTFFLLWVSIIWFFIVQIDWSHF